VVSVATDPEASKGDPDLGSTKYSNFEPVPAIKNSNKNNTLF
jgi:hypothetical protein